MEHLGFAASAGPPAGSVLSAQPDSSLSSSIIISLSTLNLFHGSCTSSHFTAPLPHIVLDDVGNFLAPLPGPFPRSYFVPVLENRYHHPLHIHPLVRPVQLGTHHAPLHRDRAAHARAEPRRDQLLEVGLPEHDGAAADPDVEPAVLAARDLVEVLLGEVRRRQERVRDLLEAVLDLPAALGPVRREEGRVGAVAQVHGQDGAPGVGAGAGFGEAGVRGGGRRLVGGSVVSCRGSGVGRSGRGAGTYLGW
ncbi:uncharacterized protein PG986_013959 [Apiospora aurea]|uniref:Uncharacterized protein n=1 Tax=Apiospora aurea TaxID=335848 RepID=A0ABR1PX42_9PEZI